MAAKPIVVGTDGSAQALQAVEWAAREAVLRDMALRIVAIPALPPLMSRHRPAGTPATVADVVIQTYERALATATERAAELEPGLSTEAQLMSGPPTQALIKAAASASMLVVGSRGAGSFSALLLGSVSRYLAIHAPCPVVVAREDSMAVRREVAVGVGHLGQPSQALCFAFEEASLRTAGLLALHAWPGQAPSGLAAQLEETLASFRNSYPEVKVSTEVADAHPARLLAEASARADLVVIGWHPTGAAGAGTTSVTHGLLGHAHASVAVIPD